MPKSNQSRLNATYITYVLSKYSDSNHPMSYTEILNKVNLEFGGKISRDNRDKETKVLSRDTVQRILDDLIDATYDTTSPVGNLQMDTYGYEIKEVWKDEEKSNAPRKFYYENRFEDFEIATIIDAIQNHSYFHEDDLQELLAKICNIKPSYPKAQRNILETELSSDYRVGSDLYAQVRDIYEIIGKEQPALLKYGFYNYKKQLEETSPGKDRVVFPIRIIWSNGYYYMIAWNYDAEDIVNYRIDRILQIEAYNDKEGKYPILTEQRIQDVLQYRAQHPVMYGGKEEAILLLCKITRKNHLMNAILDSFGKKVTVFPAKEELLKEYLGEDYVKAPEEEWCTVSFKAAPGGVELWATQYCENAIILKPEASAAAVKRRLCQGLSYYK